MARSGTVTFDLPNEAVTELQVLAGQHRSTLDGLVCDIVDNWLEGRRRDARLGRRARQLQVTSLRISGGRKE
jgi:hypothetical protein